MKIRLGYACSSRSLDVTASSVITYTNYLKSPSLEKIDKVIINNLLALEKLIDYNIYNDIKFFRLTSKLIPLATKEEVVFDYIKPYKKYYTSISKKIENMRVDFHPDQYTVLNSTKVEVVKASINNLIYHYNLLEAFNIKDKIIVLHVGSSVFGKKASITRFINTFNKLPIYLKNIIVLENDDKVYTAKDTLYLCIKLDIPMVLDYHHHNCNNPFNDDITELLPLILSTWSKKQLVPKMHFSSPKSKLKKEYRSHSDYIILNDFINFINILKLYNQDIDIMLEAKAKDEALFRLLRLLKYSNYNIIDNDIIL